MTRSSESPRQPRGRTKPGTNDGSYSEYAHDAPEVDLNDHVAIPEGTYLYPPLCTTVAEMEAFWSTVEVPEAVLHRLRRVYAERHEDLKRTFPDLYWGFHGEIDYLDEHPRPAPDASDAERLAWESAYEDAKAKAPDRIRDLMAPTSPALSRFEVRGLARALGMVGSMLIAEPDQHAAALRTHRVHYLGADRSLWETLARTGLTQIYDEIALPERYDLDASGEQGKISALEAKLDALAAQTSRNTAEIKEYVEQGSNYVAEEVGKAGRLIVAQADSDALRRYQKEGLLP